MNVFLRRRRSIAFVLKRDDYFSIVPCPDVKINGFVPQSWWDRGMHVFLCRWQSHASV